ncbi:hypothetical protein [Jidongwangia harbinensis]|uniref:hypothetical protein n=1 Tax=Jidongwangia harbinensis TaxID=2878561 RepID=UPI001CD93A40|nr:hypothetical protein [Jidongwangia harbinensis]MCA2218458.1 hypothetical protein [Jidongwangia harbinensis]
MTTQTPYGADPAVPPQAYPTNPPWATPPPPDQPPAYGPPAPYAPHGQLLVPFPEEMHNAARPDPPSWWPVVAWTWVFGPLGAIAAARRAEQARRGRNGVAPYWVAWAVVTAVWVLGLAVSVAVAVPTYLTIKENATTKLVQSKLVGDGQLTETARVTATRAACTPVGARGTDGLRRYDCVLTLNDGRTASLTVTADADGVWTAVPARK